MFILCPSVHLFVYLHANVCTCLHLLDLQSKILYFQVQSLSDCVPLHSQLPKAKFVLYVHCMSICLSVRPSIGILVNVCTCLPLLTRRFCFPIQNRLHLGRCAPPHPAYQRLSLLSMLIVCSSVCLSVHFAYLLGDVCICLRITQQDFIPV